MALKEIDLAYQILLAELEQRCLDAEFDAAFPETGLFKKTRVKGRDYWYFHERVEGGKYRKRYVGADSDPEVSRRVEAFKRIKDDYAARRKLVSTLVRDAYLPNPGDLAGGVVEALWKAGLFRMRAVLVGSVAFGCYPGLLGVRLPAAMMRTGDVDVAQFHSIAISIGDSLPPVLNVLRSVDPSFDEIPHQADARFSTGFINRGRFRVEFLTPNYSKQDYAGKPAPMPSLGGAAAQPLRFLDFLIADPVRSVMLYRGGVPVRIPAPERFAVHKLIVATRRRTEDEIQGGFASKQEKDIRQAGILVEALALKRRQIELAEAWTEAWGRGPAWREAMAGGRAMMVPGQRAVLDDVVTQGCRDLGRDPGSVGMERSGP